MKTIIIEDNELDMENLKILLGEFNAFERVGTACTIKQGLELANSVRPDLILLDIQLECSNSLEHLHKLDYEPYIICCTLYNEHALQAFEIGVSNYLTKPITPEKLNRALNRLPDLEATHLDRISDALPLNNGSTTQMVLFNQIIQIIADRDYTTVHTESNEEFLCTRRMQEWAELLPVRLFAMLDRSTIINRKQIDSFSALSPERTATITFKNQHTLEIGPTALRRLKAILQ